MLRIAVEAWFFFEGTLALLWAAFFTRYGWLESVTDREFRYRRIR